MKKIKKQLLFAVMLTTSLFISQTKANAYWSYICLHNGQCGYVNGPCSLANLFPAVASCENLYVGMFNSNIDFISSSSSGEAWIVKGNKRIEVYSDAAVAFLNEMSKKYAKLDSKDKKIQQQANSEWAAFSKRDDHKVSSVLLTKLNKETGLSIRKDVDPKGRPSKK